MDNSETPVGTGQKNQFECWLGELASPAYPWLLQHREQELLKNQRCYAGLNEAAKTTAPIGFALSGGGIRSATFTLGVFQALAQLKLLRRIDFLSTVSGGGYFGTFLGRLYTRLPRKPAVKEVPEFFDEAQWESYRKLGEHIGLTFSPPRKTTRRVRADPVNGVIC